MVAAQSLSNASNAWEHLNAVPSVTPNLAIEPTGFNLDPRYELQCAGGSSPRR